MLTCVLLFPEADAFFLAVEHFVEFDFAVGVFAECIAEYYPWAQIAVTVAHIGYFHIIA